MNAIESVGNALTVQIYALNSSTSSADALQTDGNTYKNIYEATSMNSGLTVVLLINTFVSFLGLLMYRYIILKEAGLMTEDEMKLLRKKPDNLHSIAYTPSDSFISAPPPMRWTGWEDFFNGDNRKLSRDAQIYLLFQRACILTTAVCGLFASIVLLPWYWFGGALFRFGNNSTYSSEHKPLTLLNMLKSDRGLFERFTSHNLPIDSPLILFQLPVMLVVAFCVVFLYTVVKTAANESIQSTMEWSKSRINSKRKIGKPSLVDAENSLHYRRGEKNDYHHSVNSENSLCGKEWTVFARGLPLDIKSNNELVEMLSILYPSEIERIEPVCKGRMSEVKLMREFILAKYRYEYLLGLDDHDPIHQRFSSTTSISRLFGIFVRPRNRAELLENLYDKITDLEHDLASRRSEPVRGFKGCAFITFKSKSAAESILKHGAKYVRESCKSSISSYDSLPLVLDEKTTEKTPVFSREKLEFGIPNLGNLYRAIIAVLPRKIRDKIMSTPALAPSALNEELILQNLLFGTSKNVQYSRQLVALRLRHMKAVRAPKSADIVWDSIGISFFERTIREIIVQFIVFSILILFTSPIAMLTAGKLLISEIALLSDPQLLMPHNVTSNPLVPTIDVKKNNAAIGIANFLMKNLPKTLANNELLRSAIFNYVPVLMLAVVFAAVPSILRQTCKWEGYPTKSAQELSVFRKTAFYYVMNAVVLPSLALNTASEFLAELYKQSDGGSNITSALPILKRLFSGDIAFFLCTYLVQLAFTGSTFWLMRITGSISTIIRKRIALTPLESAEAKCTDIFDFPRHYAYCVTVIAMCLLFGFMAPLVWVFAFIYFVIKHVVDLYLLRYVHPRSHIDGRVPKSALSFVLIWTVVSQLSIAAIFYLQNWIKATSICVLLCVTTVAACLSVGPDVGNQILDLVSEARSKLVSVAVGDGSNMFGWALGRAHISSHISSKETIELSSTDDDEFGLFNGLEEINTYKNVEKKIIQWRSQGSPMIPFMGSSLSIDEKLFNELVRQSILLNGSYDNLNVQESERISIDTHVEEAEEEHEYVEVRSALISREPTIEEMMEYT